MRPSATPPGYDGFWIRDARVVALSAHAGAVREAMAGGALYDFAARSPGARSFAGRGTAWATTLPDGLEIVVRHSRHGGALAPITGDLFLGRTRAPAELGVAIRLAKAGVPSPEVVAYAVYPAFGFFARADVATRRLHGADLPDTWLAAHTARERATIMHAVTMLLRQMHDAGVWHPDLNLKNVFITQAAGSAQAIVLDVDRVEFHEPHSPRVARRNLARFLRSARKWNAERHLGMDPPSWLERLARDLGAWDAS